MIWVETASNRCTHSSRAIPAEKNKPHGYMDAVRDPAHLTDQDPPVMFCCISQSWIMIHHSGLINTIIVPLFPEMIMIPL